MTTTIVENLKYTGPYRESHLLTGIYQHTPLNTTEIPQSLLNIDNKHRDNPIGWNGQFSPQLVETLIRYYAMPDDVLFDPFLGSGTLLLESGFAGIEASGTEINPAAVCLSRIYKFINIPPAERTKHISTIYSLLTKEFPEGPLFSKKSQRAVSEKIKDRLVGLSHTIGDHTQLQLFEAFIVLLDFYKPELSTNRVWTTWDRISTLVEGLPFSEKLLEVYHADARETPLPSSSIDLVITSPPYINVHNYHQQYRASVEALNWDLLSVARSEIGSNRKHRGNRFLTVIQYCLDMAQVLKELKRICKPDARMIFIVGRESTVRNIRFFNAEIVAEIAYKALGFHLILRQERVFMNRYGQRIFEDILHFSLPENKPVNKAFLEHTRSIAYKVLETVYPQASAEVKVDIQRALGDIELVRPSPVFEVSKTLQPSK